MHRFLVDLAALQTSLDQSDLARAHTHASSIASACKEGGDHHGPPAFLGPRFGELDRQLHDTATQLAEAAGRSDEAGAKSHYATMAGTCVACHSQAPAARHVRLGRLTDGF